MLNTGAADVVACAACAKCCCGEFVPNSEVGAARRAGKLARKVEPEVLRRTGKQLEMAERSLGKSPLDAGWAESAGVVLASVCVARGGCAGVRRISFDMSNPLKVTH
jgi:Fe-S-cluster containining protein